MSDKSQKTEKATPKRKRDAKRKGQVTKSTEIPVAASLIAALIALRAFAPSATRSVVTTAQNLISQSGSGLEMTTVGSMAGQMFVAGVAPFVAVGLGLGLVAGVGQVGFMLAPEAAKPKFSHISPKKGLQRFKPSVAGWDLFRTILKLGLLAVFIYDPIANGVKVLVGTSNLDRALTETAGMVWNVVVRSALLAVLIGGTDYAFNRWRTNRDMKMSKEEVKRESKDAQGDPLVKAQRRRRSAPRSPRTACRHTAGGGAGVPRPALRLAPDRTRVGFAARHGPDPHRAAGSPPGRCRASGPVCPTRRRGSCRRFRRPPRARNAAPRGC